MWYDWMETLLCLINTTLPRVGAEAMLRKRHPWFLFLSWLHLIHTDSFVTERFFKNAYALTEETLVPWVNFSRRVGVTTACRSSVVPVTLLSAASPPKQKIRDPLVEITPPPRYMDMITTIILISSATTLFRNQGGLKSVNFIIFLFGGMRFLKLYYHCRKQRVVRSLTYGGHITPTPTSYNRLCSHGRRVSC